MASTGSEPRFHWADYLVFAISLAVSSSVGIYYGWKDRKQKSSEEFIMGGRKMHFIPVSVSLFVSWVSAISFLGDPVEVYFNGAVYWVVGIGYILAIPIIVIAFVPVYYRLKLTSVYQVMYSRYTCSAVFFLL